MAPFPRFFATVSVAVLLGCCTDNDRPEGPTQSAENASSDDSGEGDADGGAELAPVGDVTYASDVEPVTEVSDAQPRVFIPPYLDCRAPRAGEAPGQGPDGKVCTHVSIAGCTEEGRYYADYADCDVVRTQRPFWAAPPAGETKQDDPRLEDAEFMAELAWVTEQARASACVCCHDSKIGGQAAQWDISKGPIWTDTVSDDGVGLFTGFANSEVLGAYPAEENNGFDRTAVGLPSTDPARMRAFFVKELARRGLDEADARAVTPFGGPIYQNTIKKPTACAEGVGVDAQGRVIWDDGFAARYVYVLEAGSANPGVPPNLDKPEGTLWRLDVLPSEDALTSGSVRYGSTPKGSFQSIPAAEPAPALQPGETYHLFVYYDVGLVVTNCLFTYEGA